jgi:pyruvate-formate lyase
MLQAFRTQVEYACRMVTLAQNLYQAKIGDIVYRPLSSLMCKSSIERGQNICSYNEWPNPILSAPGVVDAADSLTAIKKLIYDDKKVTWDEMLKALKADFEGYENVWQLCHDAPKFGDDDDFADDILLTAMNITNESMAKCRDTDGAPYRPGLQSVSFHVINGRLVAAMPYGRKAREPLADGGVSPSTGFGRSPVKVLKSIAKVDHDYPARGLLNQRLNPSTTPRQFINYIRTWGELGLSHVQFNMVDTYVLRDAQVHPEKYPDLIVRVAGYSAHFIYLTKDAQESIINRAELTLGS